MTPCHTWITRFLKGAWVCLPMACASDPSLPLDDGDSGERPVDSGGFTIDTGPDESPDPLEFRAQLSLEHLSRDMERTQNNPLKGFLTSYQWAQPANDLEDQMEFLYLPMASVWTQDGPDFDSVLEPLLDAAEARSHHIILRFYIDYPNLPSGLPSYLADTVPCQPHSHYGTGCSPDYDHPELLAAMIGLIEAFGQRYDGDPRLGFLQVGLLGFWGEWHTYPYSDWFPSEATQEAVLQAYHSSFKTTQLQVRRPAANSVSLRMGFHDDSFAYSTIGDVDWFFLPGLEAAGADDRWEQVAIGGELRPELQETVFSDSYVEGEYSQDPVACIEETHTSYLLNYRAFSGNNTGYQGDQLQRAREAAQLMGYTFELQGAAMEATLTPDGEADLTLKLAVAQTGVAPFYYPLNLQVRAIQYGQTALVSTPLEPLLPGEVEEVQIQLKNLPAAALTEPFSVELDSPILQENQSIAWATTTPWSTKDGPLMLLFDPEQPQ